MLSFPHLAAWRKCPFLILSPAILLIAGSFLLPTFLTAGTGGVEGGCAFANTVKGHTVYEPCTGMNLPMWYPVSSNPTFADGDFPCGDYGNQNCGMELGDPLNE
jgi:hypothetical protein